MTRIREEEEEEVKQLPVYMNCYEYDNFSIHS